MTREISFRRMTSGQRRQWDEDGYLILECALSDIEGKSSLQRSMASTRSRRDRDAIRIRYFTPSTSLTGLRRGCSSPITPTPAPYCAGSPRRPSCT